MKMEALLAEATKMRSDMIRAKALYEQLILDLGRRQVNCPMHGPFFERIVQVPIRNQTYASPCPNCITQADKMKHERKIKEEFESQRSALETRLIEATIPKRFANRAFGDYSTDSEEQCAAFHAAQKFAEDFPKFKNSGRSLIFAGTPGTGKSLLSAIVLQHVCGMGHRGRYTTCHGLISAVRGTWGREGEGRQLDVLEGFISPSLLIIDEIGVQAGTDSETAILFDVIDKRYSEKRPTIFVTNLDAGGLRDFIGDRIWDRLVEVAKWIPFVWSSYRAHAGRELVQE